MSELSWPEQARSLFVTVHGEEVHYLDFGGDAGAGTIVCVHGLGGSALNFGAVGPLLADGHRVLVMDLPGHGRSAAGVPVAADAVRTLVRQIDGFLEQVAREPVVLVGHSLGGVLAVLHAAASPASVRRLVLLDPPVPHRTRLPVDLRLAAKLALLRAPGVRRAVERRVQRSTPEELVRQQLADATPRPTQVPDGAVAAAVQETRLRAESQDYLAAQRLQWAAILGTIALLVRPRGWRRRLAAVTQPTLWLHGVDDLLVPVADAAGYAGSRPEWTFRTCPGVGHLPHLENPAWVDATVRAWSTEVDAARAS